MAELAQLVRASGCDPEGRRFESDISPHLWVKMNNQVVANLVAEYIKARYEYFQNDRNDSSGMYKAKVDALAKVLVSVGVDPTML